ncbi:MAG: glycosyltransferase family 1 protein [Dickeya sp.]|uniref:Glycosyltransferase family 1 protein n=1 Tax=Dickeya zeae (strain Ech586) TaxID=590409 RepID=D2BSE0_DICZ5|nr:glycosyltransferase family 1 protein [Dickeya parazeae]ACZ75559.1 hypothetical protein Dd586_0666 [Dickeya parazeae Ech586]PXW46879.1 glycosyltransferase involved in cell wall biosynthesis [Erwinia sp. AG740]
MINSFDCRVLVLHRESLVAPGVPSLSVSARVTEVLDYLENETGIEHFSVSENDECVERAVAWADVIVLSKHRSKKALELVTLAKQLGKGLIYDIDDWIFSFPSYSGGSDGAVVNYSLDIISLCDFVTVANAELMRRVPFIAPDAKLVYLPNGMWVERYTSENHIISSRECSKRIVFTNADFLKVQESKDAILSALNVFFMRHPDYVLDFFGDPFPEMFSLPFLHFTNRMPYQDYMRAIVSGDYMFAITPLGADEDIESIEFNACKNPFKYINYGVARIPGIYSSAAIYTDCVRNMETGIVVDNTFENWLSAMERYVSDENIRLKVRDAAYNDVMQNFHVKAGATVLSTLLKRLILGTLDVS